MARALRMQLGPCFVALMPDDPGAAARAIRYVGKGDACAGWIMSEEAGGINWAEALWDIRVRGANPGGTFVSIQATGTSCHPYN